MPRINIYLDEEENNILIELCKKYGIRSKEDIIKKLIRNKK